MMTGAGVRKGGSAMAVFDSGRGKGREGRRCRVRSTAFSIQLWEGYGIRRLTVPQ